MYSITVFGKPIPQGSSRAFVVNGRAVVTSAQGNTLHQWRGEIARVYLSQGYPIHEDGTPIHISVEFMFIKPKSAKKRQYPITKPDIDKCLRAVLDALTNVAYRDDSNVVSVSCSKRYAECEGAKITICTMEEYNALQGKDNE